MQIPDRQTDRRRTKWSLCAAMLRMRHKNLAGSKVSTSSPSLRFRSNQYTKMAALADPSKRWHILHTWYVALWAPCLALFIIDQQHMTGVATKGPFSPWSNQMHDDVNAVLYTYAFACCRNWQQIYQMTGLISNYWTTHHLFEIKAKYALFYRRI